MEMGGGVSEGRWPNRLDELRPLIAGLHWGSGSSYRLYARVSFHVASLLVSPLLGAEGISKDAP